MMVGDKHISAVLTVAIVVLLSLTLAAAKSRETETQALTRLKLGAEPAPDIVYPKIDRRGKKIPRFDYLVIMPDCTTCSTFRKTSAGYMDSRPQSNFLILTPDLKDLSPLLNRTNYFVVQVDPKSAYLNITPGIYTR